MERDLHPKLKMFLDHEISSRKIDLGSKSLVDSLIITAEALVGIHEEGGNNKGSIVELLQETIGKAEREPWCMSTMQSVIAYVEQVKGAVSSLIATEHCMTLYNASVKRSLSVPSKGSLILWNYLGTSNGHVGIVHSLYSKTVVWTIEGNTGAGDGVVREGDGIYKKKRSVLSSDKMIVKGFIKVF